MDEEVLNFTFAGCGFLGIYHVGVASCLREYAPDHMTKHLVAGASAGAMVAALLLVKAPLGYCTSWTLKLAAKARERSLGPMSPSFNITEHLRNGLEEILPSNAHELCNNKLHISMTRVRDGRNVIISDFSSREELIQALLCSAFIPLWSGLIPPKFRGERYVDGALSNNLPRINSYSITVSPFAGNSDICPKNESRNVHHLYLANTSVQLSAKNIYRISRIMFPPHPERLSEICKQGFEDALAYLQSNQLVNCSRHLAVRSILSRIRTVSFADDLDTLEEEQDELDGCMSCEVHKAQDRELHPSVVTALEEAVEVVNSSYLLSIKNHKTYRTFSVICSPLYLPFDLAIASLKRMIKWLPFLKSDTQWLLSTLMWYTRLLSGKVITKGKHTYTAKFVCQLAITEVQQTDITSDMVMTSRAHIRDQRIGFGVGLTTADNIEFVQNLRGQYLESKDYDSLNIATVLPTGEHGHAVFSRSGRCSVDHSRCPSRAVTPAVSRCPSRSATPAVSRRPSITEIQPYAGDISTSYTDGYLDTFEHCVDVADHTEAVLAYYYKDETGQLKTTEIFKLEEQEAMGEVPSPAELVSALAAKKLKQYGSTRSVISAVNMENEAEHTEDTVS